LPLLRKDFIYDPYQVYQARAAGADALLLIAAMLTDQVLERLFHLAADLGMQSLIEVHDEAELQRVLPLDPPLVGINNRDLHTFTVSLETTRRLAAQVPAGTTLVAESGVTSAADVRQLGSWGARAVLVGEALVTAVDLPARVRELAIATRPESEGQP
jgi:indole-3-glycerol phosphate synthase